MEPVEGYAAILFKKSYFFTPYPFLHSLLHISNVALLNKLSDRGVLLQHGRRYAISKQSFFVLNFSFFSRPFYAFLYFALFLFTIVIKR